jgi:hypothetical protein
VIARVALALATGAALWLSPAPATASPAATAAPATPAGVELVADPMFDSLNDPMSPWRCETSASREDGPAIGSEFTQEVGERDGDVPGTVPQGPVEPPHQLLGEPTQQSGAECSQVVPVQPGAAYQLSAKVRGGPVALGTEYGSVTSPGRSLSTTLQTTFTTAPGRDTVTIVVHGTAGGAPYHAWGVSLVGPPSTVRAPQPPTTLRADRRTSRTVRLSWRPTAGATGYRVLLDGLPAVTTSMTSALVSGLTAARSATLTVRALNPAGKSIASAPLTVASLPAWSTVPDRPTGVVVTPSTTRPGQAVIELTAPERVTDGYEVYLDGVRAGWMFETPAKLVDLADGPHRVTVTALNTVGTSAPSDPAPFVIGGQH